MIMKVKLNLQGITTNQLQSGAYALILEEENGNRRIPVIIGAAEAQSIAIAIEKLEPPRPLTHDLFLNFAKAYNIKLVEVMIYRFEDGIFYSELLFDNGTSKQTIDSRTSDAIALALRSDAPIYANESVLDVAGITVDPTQEEAASDASENLASKPQPVSYTLQDLSKNELNEELQEALKKENYEYASQIRDEIKRRSEEKPKEPQPGV
ncbi:MAG: bifunctional nuclease domain-containing protein [Tannerellaceae bacterium]